MALGGSIEEPSLTAARARAAEYKPVVDDIVDRHDERIDDIVGELDDEVSKLLGLEASFTGSLGYKMPDDGKLIHRFAEDLPIIFNGFNIVPREIDPTSSGGSGLFSVMYEVHVPVEFIYPDSDNGRNANQRIAIVASINSAINFEESTIERAGLWLRHSYPEYIDQIDGIILEDYEGDESNLVINLKDFRITNFDSDDYNDLRHNIQTYINDRLKLDVDFGYAMMLDGHIYVKGEDGAYSLASIKGEDGYLLMKAISLHVPEIKGADDIYRGGVCILAKLMPKDRAEDGFEAVIPTSSIVDMQSMRHSYYS